MMVRRHFLQGPHSGETFMTLDKRTREQMLEVCEEIHEDDGVNPRDFFKSVRGPGKRDHKAKQLCRQAAETLDQVLSGETGDCRLACLRVVSVQPAPDTARLLVTVIADCAMEDFSRQKTEERLQASAGRLRTAVAAAITRRKAPTLTFLVLAPDKNEIRYG
jgi:ribosome-binding factor A